MSKEIISRTLNTNYAACTFLNDKRVVVNTELVVPARYDTAEKAEKYIRKNINIRDGWRFVGVDSIRTESTLKGMYLDDFIKNATKVKERSKDTRDCITKEVSAFYAHYEYIEGRDILEAETRIPATSAKSIESADKYIRKTKEHYGKFIGTLKIVETQSIYAMPEETFAALSQSMADRFHIAE